ncbi:MAG: Polypeptide-transport-associated domain protein FtsQ-type [Acidobacteria bacterium]|jgi:cell division septal protein FtsQ|nr:Polypeptide-transport-associated domain protein FtsQ-type [Acidobacteriota bacterium]
MAKQARKQVTKTAAAKRRRPAAAARRGKHDNGNFANFFVPLFFVFCILFCLGFLGFMGYRTVTASEFFEIKKIDMRGVSRASKDEIEKIVSNQVEKSGVWNADLTEIKDKIEKLAYVKTAAVSRVLPDGVRVNLIERVPKAVVRIKGGDFWVDDEAVILGLIGENEERPSFIMRGWDETRTETAVKDNQTRVKMYQKMLEEWREFELSRRVKEVNIEHLQDPRAIVEDSSETVSIDLGKDNFGKRLQKGLEIIAGRGKEIESVNLSGNREILGFRTSGNQ